MDELKRRGMTRRLVALVVVVAAAAATAASGMANATSSGRKANPTRARLTATQLAAIPPIVRLPCSKNQALKGKVIGMSWPLQIGLVDQMVSDITKFAQLSNCGVTFRIVNANGDAAKQVIQAQQLLALGVDLLVAVPAAPQGWEAVIRQAKQNGVPVINWSSVALTGATMNSNVWQAATGALVAAPAAKWINTMQGGKAEVAMLVSATDVGFKARAAAFKEKLLRLAPGAKIVATAPGGYASPTSAEKTTLDLIQAHPNLKMIFADWDAATIGAAQAAKEAGKTDPRQFFIAGQDGSTTQLEAMAKPGNVIQATGALMFRYDAGIIVNNMLRLLMNKTLPPTRLLIPRLVTPATRASFLRSLNDPFNPKNASVFSTITRYYDQPETAKQPQPKTGP
jgi:ABC-type sugar transport system substrate-binding protein